MSSCAYFSLAIDICKFTWAGTRSRARASAALGLSGTRPEVAMGENSTFQSWGVWVVVGLVPRRVG